MRVIEGVDATMRVHAAMIHRGYVEDETLAGVPVFHTGGFASIESFLAALGSAISDAYWSDMRKAHCDAGGDPNTPYSAVLKSHCDVGLRKGYIKGATVRIYKD